MGIIQVPVSQGSYKDQIMYIITLQVFIKHPLL